ncbi:MAG: hypothetical protein Q4E12_02130 [Coriobacteriia bacterium]|nr:hypothetical protein [Coriobacteriia bacterium]
MRKLRNILTDQRGASIFFALFAFLVMAMVSCLIVTAALSGVTRVNSDRAAQQAHLQLTSAAQLVENQLEGATTTVVYDINSTTKARELNKVSSAGTFLASELDDAVEYVITHGKTYESKGSVFSLTSDNQDLGTVKVSMTLSDENATAVDFDPQYKAIFTLALEGSDDQLYLEADGNSVKPTSQGSTETWEYDWGSLKINTAGV